MQLTKVAVLGLGIIGSAWARNLIEDGLDVRPWNRTPQPDFPRFEADAARAVDGADVIIIVVADPKGRRVGVRCHRAQTWCGTNRRAKLHDFGWVVEAVC